MSNDAKSSVGVGVVVGCLLVLVLPFAAVISLITWIKDKWLRRRKRHPYQLLAAQRPGESLGAFARSLPYRSLDPVVIRAVYDEVNYYWKMTEPGCVPLRPSDLPVDVGVPDGEEYDIFLHQLLCRTQRRLSAADDDAMTHVQTVGDFVLFLNKLPQQPDAVDEQLSNLAIGS